MPQPRAKSTQQTLVLSPDSAPERVRVLLPLPLGDGYDYSAPEGVTLKPGDFVRVPLGPRELVGVVWDNAGSDRRPCKAERLRAVIERIDVPAQPRVLRRFIDWVARYTLAPPGAVLRMTMSAPGVFQPPRTLTAFALGRTLPDRMTDARRRVIEVLSDGRPGLARDIAEQAAVSEGVVRGLVKAGALIPVALPADRPFNAPDPDHPGPALSENQSEAGGELCRGVDDGVFSVTLLEGVTGAGKTEVYFEAIAAALRRDADAQAVVLVPEIALTAQWLARFEKRFGARPVEWHSDLTAMQRRRAWRAVANGEARVVVGARSALFLPFSKLSLIVVDEEHDPAFKQEEGVVYHARDMAVVRGSIGEFPVILATATPSLETVVNVRKGRYHRIFLGERHGGAALPDIGVVDLRKTPPERGRWLSPPLIEALSRTFEAGEQALLFLNRRGYAPLTLCRACGHRLQCPQCTAWLVEHRHANRLRCHHCDFQRRPPQTCPECDAEESLAPCGPGVERMAEEVAATFPDLRAAVMTSDTVTGPRQLADIVRRMADRELDLLIGTQMVTKGYHFPLLTMVGVIDADLGLAGGDLRAAERTYQQLAQVSGRAGREERPGRAVLQTYMPEHPVMGALASGDRTRFLDRELDCRRQAGMPPFGRLAAIILSGPDLEAVSEAARALGAQAPHGDGILTLGPSPAPLALLRGRHRQRFLVKTRRAVNIQRMIRRWLAGASVSSKVRIRVDIDPYSFL
ncbi:MAG: primosomal protein N' [Sphingomonadales bacterium]